MIYYGQELYHHGIKGQRWGVRRYQNEDGSLTPEGKKHYNSLQMDVVKTKKRYDNASDFFKDSSEKDFMTSFEKKQYEKALSKRDEVRNAIKEDMRSSVSMKDHLLFGDKLYSYAVDYVTQQDMTYEQALNLAKKNRIDDYTHKLLHRV